MNESIIIGSDRGSSRGPWPAITLVIVLGLAGVASWYFFGHQSPVTVPVTIPATTTVPTTTTPVASEVTLVFLDNAAADAGQGNYGCDGIVSVDVAVTPTTDPLTAAFEALFDGATTTDLVPGNYIMDHNLVFESAEQEGDVARVYLRGDVTYAGVCDDPRLTVQIRETALANSGAEEVEIFLNGEIYEAPNEQGQE